MLSIREKTKEAPGPGLILLKKVFYNKKFDFTSESQKRQGNTSCNRAL